MENKFNMEENIIFLQQVLTKIVQNAPKHIRPRSKRFDELENYLFTWSLMSDEYSRSLYGRILSRMLALEFLENKAALDLFPIWSEEFASQYKINQKTITYPDLKHPNDRASLDIFPETFLMPAYNYHDIVCVEEGDTVFDIGAWIGDTSYVFAKKLNGTGSIYAFEPMPPNYEMLVENKDKISNLSIHNLALGKENGTLKFGSFGVENSGASRHVEEGEFEVKVSTVDNFVKENGIERVDFIKADIEGAECDMLLGAKETIKRFHPKLALCIYHRKQVDHYEVPKTILSIRQDYEFYVEAYKEDSLLETVLFALPVGHIPERQEIAEKTALTIKEMYTSVHNRLHSAYKEAFVNEFKYFLDQYLKHSFDWSFNDNSNYARLFLNNNKKVHYKLLFSYNRIGVQLIFDEFETYCDAHRNKITEMLDCFLEVHIDYTLVSNKYGIHIEKSFPLSATPKSTACSMALLINETIGALWKAGIIDPEYAPLLLKEFG